ncbi:hypothetical protein LCR01_09720 [Companilactobacillus crustorum]|uniref:Uncharacterized protein n=2 Tax=Companilactobacillus TaxID=2767879 RepID=A0A2P4R6A6_9LACO|nr:hypothetical protein LCR01_09720 [Companilactobacillus crustorum]
MKFNTLFYKTNQFWIGVVLFLWNLKIPTLFLNNGFYTKIIQEEHYYIVIDILFFFLGVYLLLKSLVQKND